MNNLGEPELNPETTLTFSEFDNESFLKISNHDLIRPFFMSIVSDSDHWMFISSNGGLSAGRKNAEYALFPYYTDDKITEFADITGNKSVFQIIKDGKKVIWEPFSYRKNVDQKTTQNLYKSIYGNKIVFEEILHDFDLSFRYSWASSDQFGFIKSSTITNHGEEDKEIVLLDGIQNIMPYGVSSDLQRAASNLVDAYKRSELHKDSGLGIFALSAIIVDKAEPSEALKTNIVWSSGMKNVTYLLSSLQLDSFRKGKDIIEEIDVKGEKGAYFISKKIVLQPDSSQSWQIIADVNKNHSQVIKMMVEIQSNSQLSHLIEKDIRKGTHNLKMLVASADGFQYSQDKFQDCRNYSNVLFNIMRGGIFDNGYWIEKQDFEKYIQKANKEVYKNQLQFFQSIDPVFRYSTLTEKVQFSGDSDFIRLGIEYLPLKFSRRHGDPSRPWNKFSINLRDENTGDKILDYEGNWRDIFQNWEALAYSYPGYIDGMIFKFLNASTFDGYNPYRVTKDGFDWETIEPDDPWSYIGYWGDHQIIYLQKFLEIVEKFNPGRLESYFDKDLFVYAAVPYIIKPYEDIVRTPKDTIDFDHVWDENIRTKREIIGADGTLLRDIDDNIYHVNLIEKLLATLLAKLSNFIPEGGIWLNTQRPEWNDANNALVGNGVSMVTLYYLRRFLVFLQKKFGQTELENIKLSNELIEFYHSVRETLETNQHLLLGNFNNNDRKSVLDQLGKAASDYRAQIYKSGFWGKKRTASLDGLKRFINVSIDYIEHSIRCNQRNDGLYHAYNLMTYNDEGISITHLEEMLEGQVAVLSSGFLNGNESMKVLDAMKKSALFRPDQYSYILYPNKKLPGFLQKNIIPPEEVKKSTLLQKMIDKGENTIIEKDVAGQYHFNGNFKNAGDLASALTKLDYNNNTGADKKESNLVLEIYEKVFHHKAFTGRSGTFYGYEGLGSIYWHMVSKLLLAVQETALTTIESRENPEISGRLLEHYYEIRAGIGVHKSPCLYGAFPTDPYSHTPMHRGAQQPGMTGQVKEDLLTRSGELGLIIENGHIIFRPVLLRAIEFVTSSETIVFTDLNGKDRTIQLENNQLFFTFCHVPVIYEIGVTHRIEITYSSGKIVQNNSVMLNKHDSTSIFNRTGEIEKIVVNITQNMLK
jgi:hypothetical protein